jgi:hypothetical protein
MEGLPIEIQDMIYEKAHRLMFTSCLNDIIQQDHYHRFLHDIWEEALLEHNTAWAQLTKRVVCNYTKFTDDKKMCDFANYMMYLRINDHNNTLIPVRKRLTDYRDWAKVNMHNL